MLARERRGPPRRHPRTSCRPTSPHVELELRRGGLERSVVIDKARRRAARASSSRARSSTGCARATTTARSASSTSCPRACAAACTLKDDDYRLSFLYGNFTTLTRFTEADLERVVDRAAQPALREHPRDRPRRAHPAPAQPARRDEPALAGAAARRRCRGARPGRRVPRHQRRRRARRHAARRARPVPPARDRWASCRSV